MIMLAGEDSSPLMPSHVLLSFATIWDRDCNVLPNLNGWKDIIKPLLDDSLANPLMNFPLWPCSG